MTPDNAILVSYFDMEHDHGHMMPCEHDVVLFSHERLNEPLFAMPLSQVDTDDTYGLDS